MKQDDDVQDLSKSNESIGDSSLKIVVKKRKHGDDNGSELQKDSSEAVNESMALSLKLPKITRSHDETPPIENFENDENFKAEFENVRKRYPELNTNSAILELGWLYLQSACSVSYSRCIIFCFIMISKSTGLLNKLPLRCGVEMISRVKLDRGMYLSIEDMFEDVKAMVNDFDGDESLFMVCLCAPCLVFS